MEITREQVGVKDGVPIMAYKAVNDQGIVLEVLNLGGIITKIVTPDAEGKYENIVLAYEDIETYFTNPSYLGCIAGRTAGRIAEGIVDIEGAACKFYHNDKGNTLHGGREGFDKKIWDVMIIENDFYVSLQLTYTSLDQEEHYPGTLHTTVIYTLNNNNELIIEYRAETDKTTVVNLTNHSYFNLSGNGKRNIRNHVLQISADQFCELDEELIPTGTVLSVENTPFDFRVSKKVGTDLGTKHKQLDYGQGYDHPWVLHHKKSVDVVFYDPESSRVMEISTNQPAVVFYSMNMPDGLKLSDGAKAKLHYAACFETQKLPIGRNQVFAKQSILKAGDIYEHKTVFKFYNQAIKHS